MLSEIRIKNLAILDQVEITLEPGLNVLTGETGAGKSMIIQAVHLLLGARGSEDLIRAETEEAEIEARFWTSPREPWISWLSERNTSFEGELLLRRIVARNGRNRCYLNDQAVTLKFLAAMGRELLSLSGQHEYQAFLAPENHLVILDAYGGLESLLQQFRQVYQQWQQLHREGLDLEKRRKQWESERELVSFQLQELLQAKLHPGEDEELAGEQVRLRHASQLYDAARSSYDSLYGGKSSLLGTLTEIKKSLEFIAQIDQPWRPRLDKLGEIYLELEDLAISLRDYLRSIQIDPLRLQEVDQRLELLKRLQRKYGPSLDEVLAFMEKGKKQLIQLDDFEMQQEEINQRLIQVQAEVLRLAQELSKRRHELAPRLAQAVEGEIHGLAMPRARFFVKFKEASDSDESDLSLHGRPVVANGCDRVEFYIAPNPGEEPKPLTKIASGGELSRLVLGLKNILAQEVGVDTSVFDEVDAGIGGTVASVVGEKLQHLARNNQIICITHLPQIAAYADCHFTVEKMIQGNRTVTSVKKLAPTQRLQELARMLGGANITETTLAHAQEFIHLAQRPLQEGVLQS
jgi:DNA repair protein RecN (Recombination protein N)